MLKNTLFVLCATLLGLMSSALAIEQNLSSPLQLDAFQINAPQEESCPLDYTQYNPDFLGQNCPPDEYYQFINQQPKQDTYAFEETTVCDEPLEYDVRGSSRYCRSYWGEALKNICPRYDEDMDYSDIDDWSLQLLPDNIIYKSYMACGREPRLGIHFVDSMQADDMSYWDCSIGARVSLLRYGSKNPLYPEGLELEMDACAFPRLTLNRARDLYSCDYRFAFPLAYRKGRWEYMFGYYHISSHLGDEYMVAYNTLKRYNYSRDCLMAGIGFRPNPAWRFYFHMEYAFSRDVSKPWQFMFGLEYSPMYTGFRGAPFFALCGRLREDVDFAGSFTLETGWQWRSKYSHVFRMGLFYFNGYSDHYQFWNVFEQQIGFGIWYDF